MEHEYPCGIYIDADSRMTEIMDSLYEKLYNEASRLCRFKNHCETSSDGTISFFIKIEDVEEAYDNLKDLME
jgi:hypothetical protein